MENALDANDHIKTLSAVMRQGVDVVVGVGMACAVKAGFTMRSRASVTGCVAYFTRSSVSEAMRSSSSVGTTTTFTRLSGVEMISSSPKFLRFFS